MQITVKNNELGQIIFELCGINLITNVNSETYGLTKEDITIGTRGRIQKVVKQLGELYKTFAELHVELLKKYGAVETEGRLKIEEVSEELDNEYKELSEQDNTIQIDLIDYNKIEDVKTTNEYHFELLKRFFENYSG